MLFGVLIVAISIWVVVRQGLRRDEESPRAIGVALICFGLLYVLTFALGRAAFGITFAGASIYRIDTLFIIVGIYLALIGPGPPARTGAKGCLRIVKSASADSWTGSPSSP